MIQFFGMLGEISGAATDPKQYDGQQINWAAEGNVTNPNRQLFLRHLHPYIQDSAGKQVLDIGSGQGWLCQELISEGALALGVEPSANNVAASRHLFPDVTVQRSSWQDFSSSIKYAYIFAVMSLEHFIDLEHAERKVRSLLQPDGNFVTIIGDYAKFIDKDQGFPIQTEEIGPGETAVRIDYGTHRHGVLCDIHRTVDKHTAIASAAGLSRICHEVITPQPGHHRYETHKGKALFHLLVFEPKK